MRAFLDGDYEARSATSVVLERAHDLPADIVHPREVEWLGELQMRLAAVRAWRGTNKAVRQDCARNLAHDKAKHLY